MSDALPSPAGFLTERPQALDTFIIERIVRPTSSLIPARVTPNQITAFTPIFTGLCFTCAFFAPRAASANTSLLLGLLAGFFCFASMMSDHLDGMHARATGQSSQLGEILDHWVDSFSVALLVLALPFSLGAEGPLVSLAVSSGVLVYHTQLLVYRETGKFVYPPTGGAASAVLLAVTLMAVALVLRVLPAEGLQREIFVSLILIVMTGGQLANIRFYLQRFTQQRHLLGPALVAYALVAALYGAGLLALGQASLLWLALSFRMSGSLVLYTVTKGSYRGWDPVLLAMLGVLSIAALTLSTPLFFGLSATALFTGLISAYCLLANLREFFRITRAL